MSNAVTGGMRVRAPKSAKAPGKAFAMVVVLSLFAGLLPGGALRPWIGDLASLVWLPLRPGTWVLSSIRHVLRPDADTSTSRDVQLLTEERDRYRAMWHAERLRAEDLAQRLVQIDRAARLDRGGAPVDPMLVTVLGGGAGPGGRFLTLSAGRTQGVSAGDPVVVGGDQLIGRVSGEPAPITCWMAPINDTSIGRLDVYVTPADRPEAAPSEGVRAQLRPDARGLLVGEVDASGRVHEGDIVRLDDRQWKRSAQGMRVGTVRGVRRGDRNPLRSMIEVDVGIDLSRLRQVTMKVEAEP